MIPATKLAVLALVCCLGAGCAKVLPSVPVPTSGGVEVMKPVRSLTDAEKISLLKAEAAKRHLHWRIFCTATYMDQPESYLGIAAFTEQSLNVEYQDEGRTDEWMRSAPTQADAAFALYRAIQGAPTHPVSKWGRRPTGPEHKMRQCKEPEISSESEAKP